MKGVVTMNLAPETIELIKKFLISKLSPTLIFVFGSAVNGQFREESDLDIAILAAEEIDSYQLYLTAQELASRLSKDVDLVDLSQLSTVFKAQIVAKGELIFSKNKELGARFKLRVLKEYAFLNEERASIVEKIEQEGRVYG